MFFKKRVLHLIMWLSYNLPSQSPVDGQLGYFRSIAITNSAAMTNLVCVHYISHVFKCLRLNF